MMASLLFECLTDLLCVLQEGIRRGLYRGLTLNYIKTVPNVALYMSIYDVAKAYLLKTRPA
jgi:solute carrier family 25 protein 16